MHTLVTSLNSADAVDPKVAEIVEAAINTLQRGEELNIETLIAAHPELAAELRELLPAVMTMVRLGDTKPGRPDPSHIIDGHADTENRRLGDFQIIRELGRGGMGVVYEAEQLSMGRRVALKVLPFVALAHENSLQRFRNEVRAAAALNHPNIVSVYSIGAERGVHYYAMQLVRGQSLAELIAERGKRDGGREHESSGSAISIDAGQDTRPVAALSTIPAGNCRDYFKMISQIGRQAAEALQHAHDQGVVHRDIKPSNLLLDHGGKLYVTDFGLARIEADASLTMTGDLIGTLRYMAPEQALAKRVVIDHRADIYSLGATLYELLTLRPAFSETDRSELLKQIAFDEPRQLRKIDPRIPSELETIVLKAMAKLPEERYQTAEQLANDLNAFLENRPIKAKQPTLINRAAKWSRRNRPAVWATAAALLASTIVASGSIGWAVRDKQVRQAAINAIAGTALDDATRYMELSKWTEALAAARRADDVLAGNAIDGSTAERTKQVLKDVQMAMHLEELSLEGDVEEGSLEERYKNAEDQYSQAFRDYGIDVESLDSKLAAELIKSRTICLELSTALDIWATWRRMSPGSVYPDKRGKPLLELARKVDLDPWRNRMRDALEGRTREERIAAFSALEASALELSLPLRTTLNLVSILNKYGLTAEAIRLLRAVQKEHADDFYVNARLAAVLVRSEPPQLDEALRYYTAACALRPESGAIHCDFGAALAHSGHWDEAIVHFEQAISLRDDDYLAHCNLGFSLVERNRFSEAQSHFESAILIQSDYAAAHEGLGNVFLHEGLLDPAIASLREAVRLNPQNSNALGNLAIAFAKKGLLDEAIAGHREAVRLNPKSAEIHFNLGCILHDKRQYDEAIAMHSEAIRLKPGFALAHSHLGQSFLCKGQLENALFEFKEAVRLAPEEATFHYYLGNLLSRMNQPTEAIASLREAARLNPEHDMAHYDLGVVLAEQGENDEAIVQYKEAMRLAPHKYKPHVNLGLILTQQGRFEEAIIQYEEAMRLAPNKFEPHVNLATLLSTSPIDELRDGSRAVQLAIKACELTDYNEPHAINALASASAESGDFTAAVKWSEKSLNLVSDDKQREEIAKRMSNYRSNKPWRE